MTLLPVEYDPAGTRPGARFASARSTASETRSEGSAVAPNVGAGESKYTADAEADVAKGMVDPTPNVGGGGSDYDATTSPTEVAAGASTLGKNQFGTGFGEALSGIGQAFGGTGAAGRGGTPVASSTTVPAAQLPTPPTPVAMLDPRMIEAQRQKLAMAMQRLNSGKLV